MGRLEPIVGVEIVDDIRLGHTWHEVDMIDKFVTSYKPRNFIEVGVHEGGLSYVLIPRLNFLYYTGIEIDCRLVQPGAMEIYRKYIRTATLMCLDCFSDVVYERIRSLDNKVIYCDGGNKAKEIAHFKSACRPGDVIMCHDFYDGTRYVRGVPKENISIEVTASDIEIYQSDPAFKRLPESIFGETRIIGWKKIMDDSMDIIGS